jgi:hypothetical protein
MSDEQLNQLSWGALTLFFVGVLLTRRGYRIGCPLGAASFIGMLAAMGMWLVLHVRIV